MVIWSGFPWNSTSGPSSNFVSFSSSPKVTLVILSVFSSKIISFPLLMLSICQEAFPEIVCVSKSTLISRSKCFTTAKSGLEKVCSSLMIAVPLSASLVVFSFSDRLVLSKIKSGEIFFS